MPVDPTPNLATLPAGHIPTATELATWRAALDALSGAWTAYTPSLTNVTVGNGALIGQYSQVGKLVHFKIAFTFGSTSAFTGAPRFGLPVTAADSNWVAPCFLFDNSLGTNRGPGIAAVNSSTMVPYGTDVSGAGTAGGDVDATHPFTWAVSDVIRITGTYEAA